MQLRVHSEFLKNMTLKKITQYSSILFPDNLFNKLISILTERELLETLTYEITLGCNNENLSETIQILDLIVSYNEDMKYILERCLDTMNYCSKSVIELHKHFNIAFEPALLAYYTSYNVVNPYLYSDEFKELLKKRDKIAYSEDFWISLNKIFIEDDVDKFTSMFNLLDYSNKSIIYKSIICSIRSEAIKIFKFLYINCKFDEIEQFELRRYILEPCINIGNNEIFHMIEQSSIDISKISLIDVYNAHHYLLNEYLFMRYLNNDISKISFTSSLIYHFMYNINVYYSIGYNYDISCVDITKHDALYKSCMNVIKSNKFKFNMNDFRLAMRSNNVAIFKEMLKKPINKYVICNDLLKTSLKIKNKEFTMLILDVMFKN